MKKLKLSKRLISMFLTVMIIASSLYIPAAVINAATGDRWDLSNFVKNVTVRDSSGQVIPGGGNFYYGAVYTFTISFAEFAGANGQFKYDGTGKLRYDLPGMIEVVSAVTNGEIRVANGSVIGWYNIATNGKVEVWFGNYDINGKQIFGQLVGEEPILDNTSTNPINFIDFYTNAEFVLEIEAKFKQGTSNDKIPFGPGYEFQIKLETPPPGLLVNKSAVYKSFNETIEYTITITATGDANAAPITGITLRDMPYLTSRASGQKTAVVSAAQSAYKSISYKVNSGAAVSMMPPANPAIAWNTNTTRNGFDFAFPPTLALNPGDTITVTYTLDIQELIQKSALSSSYGNSSSYNFYIGNDLIVKTPGLEKSATTNTQVSKTFYIRKTGVRNDDKITWTCTIGDENTVSLNGKTITDTLGANMSFPTNLGNITIALYGMPVGTNWDGARLGGASYNFNGSMFGTAFSVIPGNKFTFKVPDKGTNTISGWTGTVPDIYRVVITYTVDITLPGASDPTATFRNDVECESVTDHDIVTVQPPPAYETKVVTKSGSRGSGTNSNTITWTCTIGNGNGALNGVAITDTLGANMAFPAASDISIVFYKEPTGINTSNNTIAFVDVDRLSYSNRGSGGSPNRYTFNAGEFPSLFNISGNVFTFTVPANGTLVPNGGTSAPTFPDIYRVVITYTTQINVPGLGDPSVTYTNGVGIPGKDDTSTITINPPAPGNPTITKESSHIIEINPGEYGIEYTIKAEMPSGRTDRPYFIRDTLTLNGVDGGNPIIDIGTLTSANLNVSISPAPTGSEPEFKYTVVKPSGTVNCWEIYFGGDNLTAPVNWMYATAKTITITYTIPLSLQTDNGKTVGEILQIRAANYLRNTVEVRYGTNRDDRDTADDIWPIHKTGTVNSADDMVFDYVVTLNGNDRGWYKLFTQGDAIFTDTFDSRLEYVPKSLYVLESGQNRRFGPYPMSSTLDGALVSSTAEDNGAIKIENGKITVDFSKLRQLNWNGNLLSSTLANSTSSTWYTNDYTYTIYYQLRVKDPVSLGDDTFENTASIDSTTQKIKFSNDAEINYTKRPVSKTMTANGSNIAEVEIIINKNGQQLVPSVTPPGVTPDWFVATDEMSSNLSFYLSTIKIETQTWTGTGWNGVWRDLIPTDHRSTSDGALWSIKSIDPQTVEFILPDKQPVRILYEALITTAAGQTTDLKNTISFEGYSYEAKKDRYEVQNTTASANANKQEVWLYKVDKDDNTKLTGAEFDLYMSIPSNAYYTGGTATDLITFGGRNFYKITKPGDVDSAEKVIKFTSVWLASSHEAIYLLVETKKPDEAGYTLPAGTDAYTFFTLHTQVADLNNTPVKFISDNIYVENEKGDSGETSLTLYGKKTVSDGSSTQFGGFTFKVTDEGGVTVATGTSDTGGNITFSPELSFTAEGIYEYEVSEDTPGTGWTPNTPAKTIYVKVTSTGGVLSAAVYDAPACTTEIDNMILYLTFDNSYSVADTRLPIEGRKIVSDGSGPMDGFTFTVKEGGTVVATGTSNTGGNITFNPAEFVYTEAGTHTYVVSEDQPGPGWIAKTPAKMIYVKVTDNGNGTLNAVAYSDAQYSTPIGSLTEYLTFDNSYDANSTSLPLVGTKTVSDGTSTQLGGFRFTVTDEDGETAAIGTSDTGGNITFSPALPFTEEGVYAYEVSEDDPGSGWTANTLPITIYVEVTTSPDGVLIAKAYKDLDCTEEIDNMAVYLTFDNSYAEQFGQLTVRKTLSGNNVETGRDFTFRVTFGNGGTYDGVASGSTFTLKGGESRTITGIPYGVNYIVEELDANTNGYVTTSNGTVGVISGTNSVAEFVNSRNITTTGPTEPAPPPEPTTTTPTTTPEPTTTRTPQTTTPEPTTTTEVVTTTESSTEPTIEDPTTTEVVTTTEPATEPTIDEPTTTEPVTEPTIESATTTEEYVDEPDKRVPLNNGWYAEYNENEDLWYIFDADGTPLGTVRLPEGMSIEEYDFGDWIIPLGNIPSDDDKPNPKTADTFVIISSMSILIITGALLVLKMVRRRKSY